MHNFATGNCVGEFNRCDNLVLMFWVMIYCVSFDSLLVNNIIYLKEQDFGKLYINFCLLTVMTGSCLATFLFFVRNTFYMLINSTIYEYFHTESIHYLRDKQPKCLCCSPFFKGLFHSIKIYFCPSRSLDFRIH